jgi:hypothetical protein
MFTRGGQDSANHDGDGGEPGAVGRAFRPGPHPFGKSIPAFGARGTVCHDPPGAGPPARYLKAELMAQAGDLLAAETAELHSRVVLICDAHLLRPDQLEELRLLTLCRDRDYAGDLHELPGSATGSRSTVPA